MKLFLKEQAKKGKKKIDEKGDEEKNVKNIIFKGNKEKKEEKDKQNAKAKK